MNRKGKGKKKESSLIGEFVNMEGSRASIVTLLVIFRCVQISLRVTSVIGHPQRHWSSSDGNLQSKQEVAQRQFVISFTNCLLGNSTNVKIDFEPGAFVL